MTFMRRCLFRDYTDEEEDDIDDGGSVIVTSIVL
jgi:hypothetical protein